MCDRDLSDIAMVGFSPWSAERIARAALDGTPIERIPGDFVVTGSLPAGGSFVATSAVSAFPYYYTMSTGALLHGRGIFELVARAGLRWGWNVRALRSIAWLGHTVGEDTLHPEIHRVPHAAVMRWEGGALCVDRSRFWDRIFDESPTTLSQAVETFETLTDELLGETPLVALSGGFDSRAILARALRKGLRPSVITMGGPASTDRVVAAAIARDFGLRHQCVELSASTYLDEAPRITELSSGTKTAANWHSYLFLRKAGSIGAAPLLVGSNGEFARTFYFDRGALARAVNTLPDSIRTAYWLARAARRRARYSTTLPFLQPQGPRTILRLARELRRLTAGTRLPLDGLDAFYATQRVRHFIGNGLALHSASVPTVSPFLDGRWIECVARLPRHHKLGSRLHREIIRLNAPELARYPIHGEPAMGPKPPAPNWRKSAEVGYSPFADVARGEQVRSILAEGDALDSLCPRSLREQALRNGDLPAIELLVTLHFAAEAARRAEQTGVA